MAPRDREPNSSRRPKVSIVIPVFNDEAHVADAIESALAQTLEDIEVVVVDDGSTDGTPDILRRYENKVVLVTQENEGAGGSRNAGIRVSRGEYLSFLDSDDMFMPEKSAIQAALLDKHPEVGLVYGVCQAISGIDDSVITRTRVERSTRDRSKGPFPPTYPTPAFMARREWLEKVGGFDKEMSRAMDADLRLRLWAAGCVFMPHKDLVTSYRRGTEGLSGNPAAQSKMYLVALQKHFEAMGDAIPQPVRNEHVASALLRAACGHIMRQEAGEAAEAIETALEHDAALFERYESWSLVFFYLDPAFPLPGPAWAPSFSEVWDRVFLVTDRARAGSTPLLTGRRERMAGAALKFAFSRRAFFQKRGMAARRLLVECLLRTRGRLPRDARFRHVVQTLIGPTITNLASSAVDKAERLIGRVKG